MGYVYDWEKKRFKGELTMETYGVIERVLEKVKYDIGQDRSLIEWIEDELGFELTEEFWKEFNK